MVVPVAAMLPVLQILGSLLENHLSWVTSGTAMGVKAGAEGLCFLTNREMGLEETPALLSCTGCSARGSLKGLRRGLLLSLQLKSQFASAGPCFWGQQIGRWWCWAGCSGTRAVWKGRWGCVMCALFPEWACYFRREDWPADMGSVGCKTRDRRWVALRGLCSFPYVYLDVGVRKIWKGRLFFCNSWLPGGESSK